MPTHHSFKSRTTIVGSIPSKKPSLHMVHYRGWLQRAYIYLLEYDNHVVSYEERPFSISYRVSSQIRQYTPDFRVIWKDQRPRLIACMTSAAANSLAALPRLTAAQLWCQDHDHDFAVVTETHIQSQSTLLSNLELLAVHAFAPIPRPTYEYLLNRIISIGGPFSPEELVQRTPLLHPIQTKSTIWSLVYHGELLTDLTQPLHFATTPLLWKGHLLYSNTSTPPGTRNQ
jgi:hypothetical protein